MRHAASTLKLHNGKISEGSSYITSTRLVVNILKETKAICSIKHMDSVQAVYQDVKSAED